MNHQRCHSCCVYKMSEERHVTTCLHLVLKNAISGSDALNKPAMNSLRMKNVTYKDSSQVSIMKSVFINSLYFHLSPALPTLVVLICSDILRFVHMNVISFLCGRMEVIMKTSWIMMLNYANYTCKYTLWVKCRVL